MSGENSYLSRFFVKFVEVGAASLATAISAYALAYFGGAPVLLSHASFRAGTDRCSGRSDQGEAGRLAGGEEGLVGYLKKQAADTPGPFMALLGKVLPMTVAVRRGIIIPAARYPTHRIASGNL
jgi:hypothetical protein